MGQKSNRYMFQHQILVLEDHAELRDEISQLLRHAGYCVHVAATGSEAIQVAQQTHLDVLLADVYLPDLSGIEVFDKLRATCPDLAGIVITAYSTWELAMEALRSGFVGFIAKPFVPEQLVTTIESALEQEKLRRENSRLRALVPLYELSRAFMGTVELQDLLDQIVATARQETSAEAVSLMLCDAEPCDLHIAASIGLPASALETSKRISGKGIAAHVAKTGKPLIIADGIPLDEELRASLHGRSEVLSALSLPLTTRGNVIGVLNLSRLRGGEPFNSGDLELATVLASQAAIALENARLFKQLKLLSETSQRLVASLDLNEAAAAIVAAPADLVQARGAALWFFETEQKPKLLQTHALSESEVQPLDPTRVDEQFRAEDGKGWVTIPLRHGERTLGALVVLLPSALPPNEERLGLLRTLAHAASATLESHRLRTRQVMAFREVDRAVRSDLSVRQQLERLLQQMVSACDAVNGGLFLWNQEEDRLELCAGVGKPPQEELARTVIREGRVNMIWDEPGSRSVAAGVPMRVGNRVQGAAVLTRPPRWGSFSSSQLDLLSTLTSSAALIVRNTQLYARSEEAAIAEERTRIAREIHDGLAQDLSFLVLKVSAAIKLLGRGEERELQRELHEIADQLRQDAREVRRVIFALRPLDIESSGFLPALDKFTKEFAQANDIQVHFHVNGEFGSLPSKVETALFRLTQEALNNIRKHAHAKQAWVDLTVQGRAAALTVRDNGRGFAVEEALRGAQARGSVGLMQMRERAERAGGTFQIDSKIGDGTCIQVELPIREL